MYDQLYSQLAKMEISRRVRKIPIVRFERHQTSPLYYGHVCTGILLHSSDFVQEFAN